MKKQSPILPIIGCIVINICVGILYLWSVFRENIVVSFSWAPEAAKMVSSYMLFAFVAGNLIGGFINDRKGPRLTAMLGVILFSAGIFSTAFLTPGTIAWIYLTYCVLGGLGSGFAYGACISCLQKWLPHRKGLASGLSVSAFAFSTVIFTPVSNALMNAYKVDGVVQFKPVFLILGGVFFVAGMIGTLFVSLPGEEYLKKLPKPAPTSLNAGGQSMTLGQAIKTVPFWCIFLEILFINGTWTLSIPLIKDLGIQRGLSESAAVATVSATGIFNAAGRLIMAWVSDKLGRVNTIILLSALTFVGAMLVVLNVQGVGFIIAISIIAFGYGGPSSTNAAFTTDFFGPKYSGTNYGVAMLALGVSSILFNSISSSVLKGAVIPTYLMGAFTALVPIVLMLIIKRHSKNAKKA
ncbi:MAG: OFA family MFS transporter [Clostridiales bacterium]|nr:OFA family MFS transporter [Clostridiales bacterium]